MTIGDVIQAKKQADKDSAGAQAAFEAATLALSAAQGAAENAEGQLKAALARTGPAFIQEADGSIELYLPDPSGSGYQVIKPVAIDTPVDLTAPAPHQ
jgi:hypothetical protein